ARGHSRPVAKLLKAHPGACAAVGAGQCSLWQSARNCAGWALTIRSRGCHFVAPLTSGVMRARASLFVQHRRLTLIGTSTGAVAAGQALGCMALALDLGLFAPSLLSPRLGATRIEPSAAPHG